MTDALCDLPAHMQQRWLRQGEISAGSLLAAHIQRIEARNAELGAFLTLSLESARATAEAQDDLAKSGSFTGPLHGLPLAIKDIFETAGLRTTYGSRAFADHLPRSDALHVARLRAAGAVIVGKTNTPEFAFGGQTVNQLAAVTRNPLDPSRTTAGSSGGAAAALAAGMTALADGSDLGGSARTPAAWCGLVGFRPSSGLIPMAFEHPFFPNHHTPGPMGRCVTDVALLFHVMAGLPTAAPSAPDPPAPLRIAWDMAPGGCPLDPSLREAIAPARQLLQAFGCRLEEAALALPGLLEAQQLARCLAACALEAHLKPDLACCGESFTRALERGRRLSRKDIAKAQEHLATAERETAAFFTNHDLLIWPTTAGLAFSAEIANEEITEDWRPVELTPLLGLPAISLPCGHGADGLPAGLQIIGRRGQDSLVLQVAALLERLLQRG